MPKTAATAATKAPARKTAAKATARKTPAKKAPAKRAPRQAPATVEELTEALAQDAVEVYAARAALDAAVAHRNALMVRAKAAGMSVAAIGRAAGFASTGGAQVAIAAGEAAG